MPVAPGSRAPIRLHREPAARLKYLRKLGDKKALELLDRHRDRHASSGATALADRGHMKKRGACVSQGRAPLTRCGANPPVTCGVTAAKPATAGLLGKAERLCFTELLT